MKKIILLSAIFTAIALSSCSSADLYRLNYPDDPQMQDQMEKDFGDVPFWKDNQ